MGLGGVMTFLGTVPCFVHRTLMYAACFASSCIHSPFIQMVYRINAWLIGSDLPSVTLQYSAVVIWSPAGLRLEYLRAGTTITANAYLDGFRLSTTAYALIAS